MQPVLLVMTHANSRFRLFALTALLVACAGKVPPPQSPGSACTLPIQVRLEASDRINPDVSGEALPTVVRLYQLKASVRAEEADFQAVWEAPKETLGPDLVEVQEFTLFPGQVSSPDVALDPASRFLVGVAIFRQPTGTQWRSILPLPASGRLCGAYEKRGAPKPAIVYRFEDYRVESRSRLLRAGADHDLPRDVAPGKPSEGSRR